MATQSISVTAFQLLLAEVADAIAAGDWGTAKSKAAQAEAVHMALELSVGDGGSSIQRRQSLDKLQLAIDAAASASDSNRSAFTEIRPVA